MSICIYLTYHIKIILIQHSKRNYFPYETINGDLAQWFAKHKYDDIIMLLALFYMYIDRRPLIGWHCVSNNYLGGILAVTFVTTQGCQHVYPISPVLSLLGSVGLYLRFWHLCLSL